MSSANPYAAPQSDVNSEVGAAGAGGSLEDALAGRYDFEIGEVMKEAWRLTNGFKLTYWATYLIITVASWILSFVLGLVMAVAKLGMAGQVVVMCVSITVSMVLSVGFVMLAVRRAGGLRADVGTAFSYFDRWAVAIGTTIIMILLIIPAALLLVIPAIYLGVAWGMAFPLIGDRKLGPWQALETSRKALTHRWGKIFLTWLAVGLLACLPALPVFLLALAKASSGVIILAAVAAIIPLFWTLPWTALVMGTLYRRIFGVATTA